MKVGILFDPKLGVDASEFVSQWAANPNRRALSDAQLAPAGRSSTFGDLPTAMAILTDIGVGLAASAIWDSIKAGRRPTRTIAKPSESSWNLTTAIP